MERDPPPAKSLVQRAEWIALFVESFLQVHPEEDTDTAQRLAESCWETTGHSEPVNAVQDVLIERYLKAQDRHANGQR